MAEQMAARRRRDVRDYVDRAMQQHDHAMQQQPNADESSSQGSRSEGSFQTGTVHPAPARRAPRVSEDGVRDVGVPDVGGIELWRARARIKELTQAMMGKKSFSKSKTRRCLKNLPETDRNNVVTAYNWIDDKMWSKNHIRGPKWSKYTLNPKSTCQAILRCGISIPAGTTESDYWTTMMVLAVNNKYTFAKSNVFEKTKLQHKGNVFFLNYSV